MNEAGLIQAKGNLSIDTHGQLLSNKDSGTDGGILGVAGVSLNTGDLANDHGTISASLGKVDIAAAGQLTNSGRITASDAATLDAGAGFGNSGTIYSQADTSLSSRGDIINSGMIAALNGTAFQATGATSVISATAASVLAAGVQGDGSLGANGDLTLQATRKVTGKGKNLSGGDQSIHAASLSNRGGELMQTGTDELSLNLTGALDNSSGTIFNQGNLALQAAGAISNLSGLIQTGGNLDLLTATVLDNSSGQIEANGAATLSAAGIDNSGDGQTTVSALGSIINSNATNVQGMDIIGDNGDLTLSGGSLSITDQGEIFAGSDLTFAVNGLNNRNGTIRAGADLTMDQAAAVLVNANGRIGAFGTIALTVASLDNTHGRLASLHNSSGDVDLLVGGSLDNGSGIISSGRDLHLASAALSGAGALIGGRDVSVSLQGNYTLTPANPLSANRDMTFRTTGSLTSAGVLLAPRDLLVESTTTNNQGRMSAGELLTMHTGTLFNSGSIVGGEVAASATAAIVNSGPSALIGASDSEGMLELLAPVIENRDDTSVTDFSAATTIYGLGRVILAGSKDVVTGLYARASRIANISGLIESGGDLAIHADALTNSRRVLTASDTFTPNRGGQQHSGVDGKQPECAGRPLHRAAPRRDLEQRLYPHRLHRNDLS